jgi:tetratricopeptide (TPR) repeat protein
VSAGGTTEAAAPRALAGRTVVFARGLVLLDSDRAAALAESAGARVLSRLSSGTDYLVIGMDGWSLDAGGVPSGVLQRAHRLREQHGRPAVMHERTFLLTIGKTELLDQSRQEYTPAQLARILEIAPERLRTWFRRGLLKPCRIANRLPWFDFGGLSYARKLKNLCDAGVPLAQIEEALKQLTAWFPEEESGLGRLEPMFATPAVRRPDGTPAELSGQLLLDLGQLPQARPPAEERILPFRLEAPVDAETFGSRDVAEAAAWFALGVEAEDDGDLHSACDAYQKALLSGGPDPETCFNLGNVLFRLGRELEAVQRYLQAVEIQSQYVEAWNNLGIALGATGRVEESIEAFRRAVAIEPHYSDAHYNLADTLEQAGLRTEARLHWLAYLQEDPDSELARKIRHHLGV